jgi:hypothetical protein
MKMTIVREQVTLSVVYCFQAFDKEVGVCDLCIRSIVFGDLVQKQMCLCHLDVRYAGGHQHR